MNARFHPLAWLAWFVAALAPALMTRNPLYLSLILMAMGLNMKVFSRGPQRPSGWGRLLVLAFWLVLFTLLLNVLTVHYGHHVWARLPSTWPVVGGALTLEALLFGLSSGLSLLTLLLAFATFNLDMPPSRWVRLTPPFLFQLGLITSIAVTFVPATVTAARDIYDAQRLRGHRFRRLTDYAPLLAPLVVDSLERSVQLALSMTARGFGANQTPLSPRRRLAYQGGLWGALLSILAALLLSIWHPAWGGELQSGLLAAGILGLSLIFYLQGKRLRRTAYRRWYWRPRDTLLTLGSLVLFVGVLTVRLRSPQTWLYYPYPPYDIRPDFSLWAGLLLVLVALPAVLAPRMMTKASRFPRSQDRRTA